MKKRKKEPDPPKDFEVEDAEDAFKKTEDAARRLFSVPKAVSPKRREKEMNNLNKKISESIIDPRLPSSFGKQDREAIEQDLIGSIIVGFGTTSERIDPELAGLLIDYKPREGNEIYRIALSFTELGMWISFKGVLSPQGSFRQSRI